jgi:hypothetical protein
MKAKLLSIILVSAFMSVSSIKGMEEAGPRRKSWLRQRYEELCEDHPTAVRTAQVGTVVIGAGAVGGCCGILTRGYRRSSLPLRRPCEEIELEPLRMK